MADLDLGDVPPFGHELLVKEDFGRQKNWRQPMRRFATSLQDPMLMVTWC